MSLIWKVCEKLGEFVAMIDDLWDILDGALELDTLFDDHDIEIGLREKIHVFLTDRQECFSANLLLDGVYELFDGFKVCKHRIIAFWEWNDGPNIEIDRHRFIGCRKDAQFRCSNTNAGVSQEAMFLFTR